MLHVRRLSVFFLVPLAVVLAVGAASAEGPTIQRAMISALNGFREVPAVVTGGTGKFRAIFDEETPEIEYELKYEGTEGSVTQAHIHVGQWNVNGAVSVFLCSNLGNGPDGTQPCPENGGEISGVITVDDVLDSAAAQGVAAGELRDLMRAMSAGAAYVNVHSDAFPSGELRGQLGVRVLRSGPPKLGIRNR